MDFFDVLVRYETYLWNDLDRRLTASDDVSLATLVALRAIGRREGECRVEEIRTDLAITVGAASKLVDRLERAGFVVRTAHPQDRRSSLVALTPAGRAARDGAARRVEAALAEHLVGVGELAEVTALLARLLESLEAHPAGATS